PRRSTRQQRVSEEREVYEVQAEMSRDGCLQPAVTIGDTVPYPRQPRDQYVAPSARQARQPEQRGGDTDGERLAVAPISQPPLQFLLQVAPEEGFFGQADEQQVVERPEPAELRPLGLERDLAQPHRQTETSHRECEADRHSPQPTPPVPLEAYGRPGEQQPESS